MVRTAILEIAAANDDHVRAEAVLEAATHPENPLHACFDWDDASAGHQHRLAQAHQLIRRFRVTVVRHDLVKHSVVATVTREYQSRPSQRTAEGGYEPIAAIMSDKDKRMEMLSQALKELSAIRKRYSELTELAEVWSDIDVLTS